MSSFVRLMARIATHRRASLPRFWQRREQVTICNERFNVALTVNRNFRFADPR